jgi:general secretion pathway protein F
MAIYNYQAVSAQGHTEKGYLEAESAKGARQILRSRGLSPVQVELKTMEESKIPQKSSRFHFSKSIKTRDLTLATRQLASLFSAHIPIVDALTAVAQQTQVARVKHIFLSVRDGVKEGYSFSQALAKHPSVFSKMYIAAIQAGENTGHLDGILLELAQYLERQESIYLKLQQALVYPSVVMLVCLGIISFLLVYVVPNMIQVYDSMHQSLPMMTTVLIAISNMLRHDGLVLLIFLAVLVMWFRHSLKKPAVKMAMDRYFLKLPVVKKMVILLNLGRFTRTLGMLIAAGVPLIEALTIATGLLTNTVLQSALEQAKEKVREGESLQKSLKETGYFLPMSLYFIASGEGSGQLAQMLTRAAVDQERDFNRYVDFGLTLFEPFMILVMGGVVLFIVLAILLPIFSMEQMINLS